MELKDLLITPVVLLLIYIFAYLIRTRVTDPTTKKYFIPALTVKLIGAIAVGLIYQFYYQGGDTYNYFTFGSKFIWQAFLDDPQKGVKLLLAGKEHYPDTFFYSSQIWYYGDLPSYFIVRVTAFFDLFTFHTYSATACMFALISFSGIWALYFTFYRFYPKLHMHLAIAVLFVPSVFFWGSGIMKDTLTLAALAWATVSMIKVFYYKKGLIWYVPLLLFSLFIIYSIKIYILLCFIPAMITWIFFDELKRIKSKAIKVLGFPIAICLIGVLSYLAIKKVPEENEKYSLDKLSTTAEVTARWLTFVSIKEGGSGYILGDFDYSIPGMIRKLPLAINVSLFRPYVWEVNNLVMLLAALESLAVLIFTLYVGIKFRWQVFIAISKNPLIIFCLLFALAFAYAAGLSTYNFGSLVRYKIAFIPFYLSALLFIQNDCMANKLKLH